MNCSLQNVTNACLINDRMGVCVCVYSLLSFVFAVK